MISTTTTKFVAHPNCQQHLTSVWYGKEMAFLQSSSHWKKVTCFLYFCFVSYAYEAFVGLEKLASHLLETLIQKLLFVLMIIRKLLQQFCCKPVDKMLMWLVTIPAVPLLCIAYLIYPQSKVCLRLFTCLFVCCETGRIRLKASADVLKLLSTCRFIGYFEGSVGAEVRTGHVTSDGGVVVTDHGSVDDKLNDGLNSGENVMNLSDDEVDGLLKNTFRPCNVHYSLIIYILGMMWVECKQLYKEGMRSYLADSYNCIDFIVLSLYISSYVLRIVVQFHLSRANESFGDLAAKAEKYLRSENFEAFKNLVASTCEEPLSREKYFMRTSRFDWQMNDPEIVSDMLFGLANVWSIARTTYLMPAFEVLGPLQIALGRMMGDIAKVLVLFTLVLMAFMVGLHNLYCYYGSQTYRLFNNETFRTIHASETFQNLWRTLLNLFWSMFGVVPLDSIAIKHPSQIYGSLPQHSFSSTSLSAPSSSLSAPQTFITVASAFATLTQTTLTPHPTLRSLSSSSVDILSSSPSLSSFSPSPFSSSPLYLPFKPPSPPSLFTSAHANATPPAPSIPPLPLSLPLLSPSFQSSSFSKSSKSFSKSSSSSSSSSSSWSSSSSLSWSSPSDASLASHPGSTIIVEGVGLFLFALYHVTVIIVLVNMLIAMMSHSFEAIQGDCDVEWKFARTKLWMSYIIVEDTLPIPFNMLPTLDALKSCCGGFLSHIRGFNGNIVKMLQVICQKKLILRTKSELIQTLNCHVYKLVVGSALSHAVIRAWLYSNAACLKLENYHAPWRHGKLHHTTNADILQRLVRRYLFKLERMKDEINNHHHVHLGDHVHHYDHNHHHDHHHHDHHHDHHDHHNHYGQADRDPTRSTSEMTSSITYVPDYAKDRKESDAKRKTTQSSFGSNQSLVFNFSPSSLVFTQQHGGGSSKPQRTRPPSIRRRRQQHVSCQQLYQLNLQEYQESSEQEQPQQQQHQPQHHLSQQLQQQLHQQKHYSQEQHREQNDLPKQPQQQYTHSTGNNISSPDNNIISRYGNKCSLNGNHNTTITDNNNISTNHNNSTTNSNNSANNNGDSITKIRSSGTSLSSQPPTEKTKIQIEAIIKNINLFQVRLSHVRAITTRRDVLRDDIKHVKRLLLENCKALLSVLSVLESIRVEVKCLETIARLKRENMMKK
ncbi:hypothetical protein HELRODRAFT_191728 [Helobdella robusta]|uniref:Ion transport domain-containing protein n=1 Tax=Helobdella robusta TaxID=6412 RepID=T1FT85_HELRO|nr:hypothetical protein HELRODRAFT_191728 [Helobdella robusta]ESO04790.1 hypothetical protein HELRODRAFT_191728 [Helobdella robusta]